jgi:hypothetical protein
MDRLELPNMRPWRTAVVVLVLLAAFVGGCGIPSPHTTSRNYGLRGDVPVDPPQPIPPAPAYDDCAKGGRLFKLYCGSCHNARPLGERPFSNYNVAVAHMRDQAYLTGKEYRQIILFLRRWDNVGPPTPPTGPSLKRFVYGQPVGEPPANDAPPPPAGGGGAFRQPGPAAPPDPMGGAAPQPAPNLPNAIE